jgi:LPS-assembly protein
LLFAVADAKEGLPGKELFPKMGAGAFLLNGPVHIDADTLTYDEGEGVALAEGNVEISLGTRTMRADRIRYDSRTGEAELAGRVRYKDAEEEFSFDRIVMNLNSETGILYNGSILISSNNYRIASQAIEKTGKQSFRIEKGSLTTCPCDPEPDWKFEFRRSQVVLDGYAFAKDITFRVRGTPVLWLPYAAFPVKLTRQSGMLLPGFSNSKSKGFTVTVPFYWAINRWSDATLTVDSMSRRGVRPEAEYRFVPNRESEGVIRGSIFRDKSVNEVRWRAYGENIYHSGDWTANGRLELPSDNQYYVDFEDSDRLRSARHAKSTGFLGRHGENSSQQLSVTWYKELEQPSGDNTVQRLPEYSATLLPYRTPFGNVDASGEIATTLFYRDEGDKAVRGRGTVTLSRTFVLYPSISLTPYASVNFLATRFQEDPGGWDDAGRVVPAGGIMLAAEAQRSFLRKGEGFVHVVGSNIGYRQVHPVNQDSMPVVDRWSRLSPQNQFVVTLAQRFLRLKDSASPQELASMHIEWAYDVGGREPALTPYVDPLSPFVRVLRDQIDLGVGRQLGTGASSDVYGKLIVTPIERWSVQGETLFDPRNGVFWMGAVSGGWKKDEDHRVGVEYRVTRDLADDVRADFAWRPWRFLRLQAQMNYSLRNSVLTDGSAGFTLAPKSDCWSIGFVAERKTQPYDTSLRLVLGLKGIGSVGK